MTQPAKAQAAPSERRITSVLISSGALGLLVAHLRLPGVEVDSVSIGLLALAVLPWLAPILKGVELPGGWRFEFRELQRQVESEIQEGSEKVEALRSRIEEFEQSFSGAVSLDQVRRLSDTLAAFDVYLRGLGLDPGSSLPEVHIMPGYDNAHYNPQEEQIVIGQDFVDDNDVLLREYAHHALFAETRIRYSDLDAWGKAIESAFADYYPCSFKGSPLFAPVVAVIMGSIWRIEKPYLRNLRNHTQLSEVDGRSVPEQRVGEVLGAVFWEIRQLLGSAAADQTLLSAWQQTMSERDPVAACVAFPERVVAAAGAATGDDRDAIRSCFERHGIPVPESTL